MKQILEKLEQRGIRITKTRKSILELFLQTEKPLSALELQSFLHSNLQMVNKTTVYRELEFLLKQNIIASVFIDETQKRYELLGDHHHHIVCRNCGDLEDIEIDNMENIFEQVEKKLLKNKKFKNIVHSLEFFGVCARCSV
jgi:Fur family ferric uptake transcriptional regulator